MFELNNFDSIKIGVASPEKIREWSHGEVTKPETINYRTQKPEKDGLFCEKIFGPRKDWECQCGRYKRVRYKGVVCDKCGVEVTRAKVRRERMGHIELAAPCTHIWFFRNVPSKIGTLLEMTPKVLEQIVYYVCYVVLDPKRTDLAYKQVITDKEYADACEKYGYDAFEVGMGAEAIKRLLGEVDLKREAKTLKEALLTLKGQRRMKAMKKLDVVESFLKSGNSPTWMVLDVVPVLPPDLRPMVPIDGGRYATSDLNDLYRRVINRNNRLKKLMELGAPDVIVRNEKRMLQEAVDNLIDNGKRGKAVQSSKQRDLKSLTAMLGGKQGRFRLNLLGKRVDYSGRSVIVVGPELKMYQCGLPKEMALELFKPFIMNRLVDLNKSHNIKAAKRMIENAKPVVWDILAEVIKDHPVFLNRAPTLHRLSVQAFEPVLVEGRAIKLHPSVCAAFNADFDGDQMSVHVPLSLDARTEARTLMLASNNILKLADGEPIVTPSQDIILGCAYMTMLKPGALGEGSIYASPEEAKIAYATQNLHLQAKIKVRLSKEVDGKKYSKVVETSVGRILFNEQIPQDLGFVDRTNPENICELELNKNIVKKDLGNILARAYDKHGTTECAILVDKIKETGYKYSTLGALTVNAFDIAEPKEKAELLKEAEAKVLENEKLFKRGLITNEEKIKLNNNFWEETKAKVVSAVVGNMAEDNPFKVMFVSGARGNSDQINSMAGMIGLKVTASGERVGPIKSSFVKGLTPIEYFITARGIRKSLSDTALKTADSGYLTRRLVDISQDVVVTTEDCFADLGEKVKGVTVGDLVVDGTVQETLAERIYGRVAVDDIVDPKTGEIIVKANEMISKEQSDAVEKAGIKQVQIRSLFTCRCKHGVCAKCYGRDMSNKNMVTVGEAVGIIAAQSIGEPGTQLTMRTFHTGGVASALDITQGLPRVEEIFEARKPKGEALISEVAGKVSIKQDPKYYYITVQSRDGEVEYEAKKPIVLLVKNGETVEPGSQLTAGAINPAELLRMRGVKGLQDYMLNQVIDTYRGQGVKVNDKHVELIIRQMLKKVKVESSGDTSLLPGEIVDVYKCDEENERILREGGVPATVKRILLGITKASLSTESFLSAASFQETSRTLTDAAVKGKVDNLLGLKENVIIGKLIPAGTGLKKYRSVMPVVVKEEEPIPTDAIAE
ncbi:MAG: DNA-directed RNA polymerase subunit beta' [Clostridia bacterium]|nr:DNA-directed RNA polymerase subunit beta' [Clostridia bacterium]